MNKISRLTLILLTLSLNAFADVEWTRFKGTVKAVNLKAHTLTIQNTDGDLFTIPIDYQVTIVDRKNVMRDLKDVQFDTKVVLLRVISEKPTALEESDPGLVPYRGMDPVAGEQEPVKRKK